MTTFLKRNFKLVNANEANTAVTTVAIVVTPETKTVFKKYRRKGAFERPLCSLPLWLFWKHGWWKKEIHTDITVSVDEPFIMAKEAKQHVEKRISNFKN